MSEQQLAELYERLTAAKFNPGRPAFMYPYQRGWNLAIDFAIKLIRELFEPEPPPDQP